MRKDEVILKIAKKYFYSIESRGDLKSRYNDNEDFIDVAVWNIEAALIEAYEAGRKPVK